MINYDFNVQILMCLSFILLVLYNILNNHYYHYSIFHLYRLSTNLLLIFSLVLNGSCCYISNNLSTFYYMECLLIEKGKSMDKKEN